MKHVQVVSLVVTLIAVIVIARDSSVEFRKYFDTCAKYLVDGWTNYSIYICYGIVLAVVGYHVLHFLFTPIIEEHEPWLKEWRKKNFGKTPPVFPNGWFKVLHSYELKPGDSKYVEALGLNLVIFRENTGAVRCLSAYCTHLGSNLGVWGQVVDNCIKCPFHGWCFDGEGKCVSIPYEEKIPSNAHTKAYKVYETNGIIWLFYDAEDREPTWYPPHIEGVADGTGKYVFHGAIKNRVTCHIQEIPENGADVQHLGVLHRDAATFGFMLKHKWHAEWEPLPPPNEYKASMLVKQELTLFGFVIPGTLVKTEVTQIGPGFVYLSFDFMFGKMFVIESQTPLEPFLQSLEVTVYADWKIPRFLAKLAIRGFMSQFVKDLPIWNNKTFAHKPVLVKKETPITKYRRWFAQFYSEHSPTLQSLDW